MEKREAQEELIHALRRFGRLPMGRFAEREGLTQGEFFGLDMLRRYGRSHPEARGAYVWEMAQNMRLSPPGASRMLRGMENKGLIERSVDREDRRNTCITVTAAGDEAWERTMRRMADFMTRVIARMGPEDMGALIALWNRFFDALEDELAKENAEC